MSLLHWHAHTRLQISLSGHDSEPAPQHCGSMKPVVGGVAGPESGDEELLRSGPAGGGLAREEWMTELPPETGKCLGHDVCSRIQMMEEDLF